MRKLLLALALVTACGGDSPSEPKPDPIEIAGSWLGTFNVPSGGTGTLTMTLQETNGQVAGNGNITGPGGSLAIVVTGTYSEPSAALAIASSGFNDLSLTGTVGETQFNGQFQGSGFTGTPIVMTRQ